MKKSRNKKGQFKKRETGEFYNGFPVYEDSKGYKIIWCDNKDIRLHVLIWESANGKKPLGHEIHHIDHDKGNYNINNLQMLTHSDHQRVHAGWVMRDGEWVKKPCNSCGNILTLDKFYKRKGYTPTALCKPCHIEKTRKWALKNEEKVKGIKRKSYEKHKKQGGKTYA